MRAISYLISVKRSGNANNLYGARSSVLLGHFLLLKAENFRNLGDFGEFLGIVGILG